MIIYNVTVNIDKDVSGTWLQWMKEKHIPDVLSTGCFIKSNIYKILAESEGGVSYSIQYTCNSMDDYNRYKKEYALDLQNEHKEKFHSKFAAFRTLLKVII